jgi:hypothetical protein
MKIAASIVSPYCEHHTSKSNKWAGGASIVDNYSAGGDRVAILDSTTHRASKESDSSRLSRMGRMAFHVRMVRVLCYSA